jgi:hypothetical protein
MARHQNRLDETRATITSERDEKMRARERLNIEIDSLSHTLDLLNGLFTEPESKKRARPGTVEAAIMKTLADRPGTADQIVSMTPANPESTRHALRRLVAAGKLRKDGESYSIAAQAQAAE